MTSFYLVTALTAIVGAIVSMVVGFVWYGPLFGKKNMEVMGMKDMMESMTAEEKKGMHKKMLPSYLANLLVAFVQFYALGFFAAFIGRLTVTGAIVYGAFLWLGFIVPIEAGNAIWSGKSKKLSWTMFGLSSGYQFVVMLLGAILWAVIYPHFL
jgi:hypothetical protein